MQERTKMKKQTYMMIALLALVGSIAVAGKAQSVGRTLVATIPFQFMVGSQTLPAGEYSVRRVNSTTLQLQTRDGSASTLVQVSYIPGKMRDQAVLIFNRYGNKYFFAEAWTDGEIDGMKAVKSRSERAAQKEIAGLKPRTETVALRSR